MDTKELPAHPCLDQYKEQAKDLLKSVKSGHPEALQHTLQRIKKDHPRFGRLADLELQGAKLALADAQLVIAREHGFGSWPGFAKHIEGLTRQSSPVSRFESAVDAVVTGDVAKLNQLLGEDPELVRERFHVPASRDPFELCGSQWRGELSPKDTEERCAGRGGPPPGRRRRQRSSVHLWRI